MATLPSSSVRQYESDGYVAPIRVLDRDTAARFRASYEAYATDVAAEIAKLPARDQYVLFAETHAYLPWAYDLATEPSILDAVESILGPDLLIWDSRWFVKQPGDLTYISWHQDGTYWALDPPLACTAWIALSTSNAGNGAMQIVPGSHAAGQLPHVDTFVEANALARGQEIAVDVDENAAVTLTLDPGEMSIHHIGVVHGSKPNASDEPRIGLAVRYISPRVKQSAEGTIAMLVRGEDRHGHYELLEPPRSDDPADIEAKRSEIVARLYSNLLASE